VEFITLDLQDPNRLEAEIEEAVKFLRAGKVIVYPTDTLYGLGCDALNEAAVQKINAIKKRKDKKPLSVMVRDVQEVKKYAFLSAKHEKVLSEMLPGAFTFILPGVKKIPAIVTGGGTNIGIRIPDHPITRLLSERFENPIVTTSVNLEGEDPLNDPFKIVDKFKTQFHSPGLILDAGKIAEAHPSVVVDISGKQPRILRTGMMNVQETLALLTRLSD
jgi:L-threonylcarbamoyladenylate synthase